MLSREQIEDIELKLTSCADVYYDTSNSEKKELNRGYCQGVAFILEKIGYSVEWDNGKAIVVDDN